LETFTSFNLKANFYFLKFESCGSNNPNLYPADGPVDFTVVLLTTVMLACLNFSVKKNDEEEIFNMF